MDAPLGLVTPERRGFFYRHVIKTCLYYRHIPLKRTRRRVPADLPISRPFLLAFEIVRVRAAMATIKYLLTVENRFTIIYMRSNDLQNKLMWTKKSS